MAGLYYSAYAIKEEGLRQTWPLVSLVVFGSVVVHGVTSYPASRLYARIAGYQGKEEDEGSQEEKDQEGKKEGQVV